MPVAGKNSIHILRGANVKTNSSIATLTLSNGQPLYDTQTGYLYIGEGNTIANTAAVKASYANSAASATVADYLTSTLPISSGGTGGTNARTAMKNLMMNVDASTNPGSNEYLVFATSTTAYRYNYGYIKNDILSEVSTSSVTNANYANFAGTAYKVSGPNVQGAVNSANYAITAGKVDSNLNIRVAGTNYTFNGGSLVNIRNKNLVATNTTLDRGAIPYVSTNGTTSTPANFSWLAKGTSGQVLTATSTGIAWRDQSLPGNGYPYFVATIDNQPYEDIPITQSATYLLLRVVGGEGNISVSQRSGISNMISLASISSVVLGVRVGSNQLTLAYPNGHTEFHTASSGLLAIRIIPGGGTRFSLMKLSDE